MEPNPTYDSLINEGVTHVFFEEQRNDGFFSGGFLLDLRRLALGLYPNMLQIGGGAGKIIFDNNHCQAVSTLGLTRWKKGDWTPSDAEDTFLHWEGTCEKTSHVNKFPPPEEVLHNPILRYPYHHYYSDEEILQYAVSYEIKGEGLYIKGHRRQWFSFLWGCNDPDSKYFFSHPGVFVQDYYKVYTDEAFVNFEENVVERF